MSRAAMLRVINEFSEAIATSLDFELVDVEYVKEHGNYFLRIYIDKEGGIGLDDCQNFSEILSTKLDEHDPIEQTYYLEVSSPGLDRPIKTEKDLKRNLNREVEIRLYKQINNKKTYIGKLKAFDEEKIVLTDNKSNEIKIPRDYIALIRLNIKI